MFIQSRGRTLVHSLTLADTVGELWMMIDSDVIIEYFYDLNIQS